MPCFLYPSGYVWADVKSWPSEAKIIMLNIEKYIYTDSYSCSFYSIETNHANNTEQT